MLLQGNEDLRVQKTVTAIQKAFRELVLEMSWEELTVRALCERAMVNKKTFYRYYPTLHDLLAETVDRLNKGYLERVQGLSLPEDLPAINRIFFTFAEEQGPFYEKLVCHPDFTALARRMMVRLVRDAWSSSPFFATMPQARQNLLVSFLHATGTELYRQWVADGRSIPMEEMVRLSSALLSRGVEGLAALER